MIDTIEIRVHAISDMVSSSFDYTQRKNIGVSLYHVEEHHQLYKSMLKYKGKFFNMVKTVKKLTTSTEIMTDSEFLHFQTSNKNNNFQHIQDVMRFTDQDTVKETNMRINGKYNSPSSISAVTFKINENGGYIDFNLSIPKYLYSHSLAEFIPQAGSSTYFNNPSLTSVNSQRKIIYKRFLKFLDLFINDLCHMFKLDTLLNKEFIELRRLDLCINQYFDTKHDALNYLEHQKKITKVKSTSTKNKKVIYDTSITYNTSSGAYFKIYHKGTEYTSSKFGDLHKHLEFNKLFIEDRIKNDKSISNKIKSEIKNRDLVYKLFSDSIKDKPIFYDTKSKSAINNTARILKDLQPFKIDFLKNEMDKILRYEISLRGDFFSYNYKTKIFRNQDDNYQNLKKIHSLVHSYYHTQKHKEKKVTKQQLNDYKSFDKFLSRKISLTFSLKKKHHQFIHYDKHAIDPKTQSYRLKMIPYDYSLLSDKDVGVFNDDILQLCINYFFKTVSTFQLEKLNNFSDITSKITEHNLRVEHNVNQYNSLNHYLTKDIKGNYIFKGNKRITKAVQLLTETQKRIRKLKKVQSFRLSQILLELERGKSLKQIRHDLNINKSTYSRLKADLEMFGVFENTLQLEKVVNTEIDFKNYYHNTQGFNYQKQFYFKEKHFRYE